jgi:hypothetical protein
MLQIPGNRVKSKNKKGVVMKGHNDKAVQAELESAFLKLEEHLSPEVLREVRTQGFRDAMILEYRELAEAMQRLIGFIDKYEVQKCMDQDDSQNYNTLMGWLSVCAQRVKMIIEESSAMDHQAMLALSRPEGRYAN